MAGFSDFSEEEKLLVVSIPYRVGMWVSNADDNENTKHDDKIEAKALEEAMTRIAGKTTRSFASSIISHTLKSKKAWKTWRAQSDEKSVLEDLAQVLEICKAHLSKEQISEYKKLVWNLALVVARSYGEHIDPDNEMHVNRFFGKLLGKGNPQKAENISEIEKETLKKLQVVLKG